MANICEICFDKQKMKDYYCITCKNITCDVCYSKVLLKNDTFNEDYLDDKLIYNCPFCKGVNKLGVNVNHSINNNIIKGLIKRDKPAVETELMERFLNHFLTSHNRELSHENNRLKNKLKLLESELDKKQESNIKLLNICTNVKSDVNVLNYKLNGVKNINLNLEEKNYKIKGLLNTAAESTKKGKLYKDLNKILNE